MPLRSVSPTSALFTMHNTIPQGASALLLHSDDPALGRWLVSAVGTEGQVTALHTSFRALNILSRVKDLALSDSVYPDAAAHGPADVALLDMPKGRSLIRAYLWMAANALCPGGTLYLAGPNSGGAKSAIKDAAELFGDAPVIGYKSGHRLATATRPDVLTIPPGWADPAPWQVQMRAIHRPEGRFQIVTLPGVFSWDHLDDGTAMLLDHMIVEPDTDVLDIGCGYGIVGLVAARAGARVVLVDDNLLAVRCARASVAANYLNDRCTVLPSDVTSSVQDREFDLILSNPPFHQGVDVTTSVASRIIREGYERLRPDGRLRIVANRFLAYNILMETQFGNVLTIAETGRYHVLESVR